jgi:hypothetical protein
LLFCFCASAFSRGTFAPARFPRGARDSQPAQFRPPAFASPASPPRWSEPARIPGFPDRSGTPVTSGVRIVSR